jgi:hypothetical protein
MADKAVILARASSGKQVIEGDTLDDQIIQCNEFAEKNSWDVVKTFPLVESGRKREREFFEEVLDYCENRHNKIKYLVFKNISRFTRGGDEAYLRLKTRLSAAEVEIRDIYGTIREDINTMDSYGLKYDWSVTSPSQAHETYEANKAKDFVRDALTQMIGAEVVYARKGYWNRESPYGYSNQKIETSEEGKRNILVPHPKESEHIKTMFKLRATGPMTDKEIVTHLNDLGFRSRIFHKRDKKTKKIIGKGGGIPLTVKRMQEYIRRPIYAGIICEKWTNNQPVKTQFPGLIDRQTFNLANRGKVTITGSEDQPQLKYGKEKSAQRIIKRRSRNNPLYPFKNVILCPLCGQKIHASASKGRSGQKYPGYHHYTKKHKSWRVPKEEFENTVYDYVKKLSFSDDFVRLFKATFLEVWKEKRASSINESKLAEEHVAELLTRQAGTLDSIKAASSQIVIKALESDYESLEQQIAEARLARANKEQSELDVKSAIKYAVYLMEHIEELLIDTDNSMQQEQLMSLAFEELPRYDQILNGTAKLSPIFKLNLQRNLSKSELVTPSGFEPELLG